MKVERTVLFETLERQVFLKHVLPLAGIICDEEDITSDSRARAERKKKGASDRAGWYSTLRRLTAKGEAWNTKQLLEAYEIVKVLRAEVWKQARVEGWPVPKNELEEAMRDVLIKERRAQFPAVKEALHLIWDARELASGQVHSIPQRAALL